MWTWDPVLEEPPGTTLQALKSWRNFVSFHHSLPLSTCYCARDVAELNRHGGGSLRGSHLLISALTRTLNHRYVGNSHVHTVTCLRATLCCARTRAWYIPFTLRCICMNQHIVSFSLKSVNTCDALCWQFQCLIRGKSCWTPAQWDGQGGSSKGHRLRGISE